MIQNLVKGVTKVNPLFNTKRYEAELFKATNGHSNDNLLSPDNENLSDDWNPQEIIDDQKHSVESQEKNSMHYCSVRENNQVNQLKNFSISAYQRPSDTDILFNTDAEVMKQEQECKISKEKASLAYDESKNSIGSNLPRNNSFSAKNNIHSERSSVKRSTSHVSLVNSGRTLRAKSIGNLSIEASREDYGMHTTESGKQERRDSLRKTTSEANINQDYGHRSRLAELQDQFLQWQEQLLRQTQPDIPLQSLQVLRSILSPSQEVARDKSKERKQSEEPTFNEKDSPSESRNETNSESCNSNEVQLRRKPSNASNDTKRYSYHGPPAVNFSTWSERPRSQVSIKVDSDYRIGKGQIPLGSLSSKMAQSTNEGTEVREKSETEDRVDSKVHPVSLNRSESLSQVNGHAKIEPTALTMRIISHTTPSGYKKVTHSSNFIKSQDSTQSKEKESAPAHHTLSRVHSYSSAQIADPSRVPIVRAVELKKSFLQGQVDGASDANSSSPRVKLSWDELNSKQAKNDALNANKTEDEKEEKFQGVNNLAKRFSQAASNTDNCKPIRPTSAYFYSESKSKTSVDLKGNCATNPGIKESSSVNISSGSNTVKKYTSVVGVNGIASSGNFKEPPMDSNKVPPRVTVTAAAQKPIVNPISKSNAILNNSRHPMPVVKGFRFATSDYSDSSLVAADSYKVASNAQQPVTVKVQHSNSFVKPSQRSSVDPAPSVSVRIQPPTAPKPAHMSSNVSQQQTVAPCAPPLPKKTLTRPKSFPALEVNARDQLMDAIRSFGGRGNLRQTNAS